MADLFNTHAAMEQEPTSVMPFANLDVRSIPPAGNLFAAARARQAGPPDIFDQIAPDSPFADMPDENAHASPFADMPGEGDVFDQISPEPVQSRSQMNPFAAARARQGDLTDADHAAGDYMRSHGITDPEQVAATYEAYRHAAAGQTGPAAPNVIAPDNAFESFGKGVSSSVARPVTGAVGLIDPEFGAELRREQAGVYHHDGVSGSAGEFVGGIANAPYAMTPAGRILSAAEASGNKRIDIAERRARGEDVSGWDELSNSAGAGALDLGTNLVANKLLGSTVGPLGKQLVGKPLLSIAARLGTEAVGNAGIAEGRQFADNVLNRVTSDPHQKLMQGVDLKTGLTGAGQGLLMAGLHTTAEAFRPQAAPHVETPTAPTPEQVDLSALHQRLQGHLDAEHTPAPVDPAAEAREQQMQDAFKQASFETPKEVGSPTSPEDQQRVADMGDKLRTGDFADRRQQDVPVENERRFEKLTKGATFETPQEAGAQAPRDFFAAKRAVADQTADAAASHDDAADQQAMDEAMGEQHEPAPVEPKPSVFAAARDKIGPVADFAKRLISDEGGGTDMHKQFVERDVIPAVQKRVSAIKDTLAGIDRAFGLGFTATKKGKGVSLDVRESMGEAENAAHKFEASVAPFREHFDKLSPDAKRVWMDDVEAGGDGNVPEAKPAVEAIREMRTQNAERGKKLGINNLDEEGLGLARMFDFPDSKGGKGKSMAGTNQPFFRQTFNTYSEALKAAEAAGGKPKYANPLDAQIARQYQVEKNLAARENMRAADVAGIAEWVPNGKRPVNEANDTQIADPIVGRETRKMALPTWMVGRFAKLTGFEANQYLDQNASKMVAVRAGEQPPEGYSFTPRTQDGTFYADGESAAKYNNLLGDSGGDPLAGMGKKVARDLVKMRYDLNLTHATMGAVTGAIRHVTNAIGRAGRGEFGPALESLQDAATGGFLKGRALRRDIEAGTAGEVGDRVMKANPVLKLKSITDTSWVKDAKQAFSEGNPIGGVARTIAGVVAFTHDATFHEMLPNILAGHASTVAENQIRRGVSAEAGRAEMANEVDTTAKLIGHHLNTPEFQNNASRQIASILIPAARFWEGQARAAGGVTRGNKASMAFFATGAVTTALVNTALQMALTKANTGTATPPTSLNDLLHPRTGRKDDSGRDERIHYPNPIVRAFDTVRHPVKQLGAIVHPSLTGAVDVARNRDWRGDQVMPDDASTLSNAGRALWHVGKGALPMGTPDPYAPADAKPQTLADRAMGMIGVRLSHPVMSDAEQAAYDVLDQKSGSRGRNLAEQQQHADDTRWVQMARHGQEDAAAKEMEQADVSEEHGRSIFRRAAFKQGLAGLVTDSQYGPDDLLRIWGKATPDEQAAMKEGLGYRFEHAKPTSAKEGQAWETLYTAVTGEKP